MLYGEGPSVGKGALTLYLPIVILGFSVGWLVTFAARVAIAFSRPNDACSKHQVFWTFPSSYAKPFWHCPNGWQGLHKCRGCSIGGGIIIPGTGVSGSILWSSVVLHCPLLGLSHSARTKSYWMPKSLLYFRGLGFGFFCSCFGVLLHFFPKVWVKLHVVLSCVSRCIIYNSCFTVHFNFSWCFIVFLGFVWKLAEFGDNGLWYRSKLVEAWNDQETGLSFLN